jgi:hypothetical protein
VNNNEGNPIKLPPPATELRAPPSNPAKNNTTACARLSEEWFKHLQVYQVLKGGRNQDVHRKVKVAS